MNTNTKITKNRMWTQVLQKDVNSRAPEVCELKCSWRVWTQVLRKGVTQVLRKDWQLYICFANIISVYADVCMYSLFIFLGKILINTDLWKSIHYKYGLDPT